MILTIALSNARTRKPFKGVAAFYRALHAGVNPVFYVSKSPWNLYAPLVEYLEVQGLPLGPLMLRDFGLASSRHHKREAIEAILTTYPKLRFVLIGDSGEQDPEIYSAASCGAFPQRIRAIYIRSVESGSGVRGDRAARSPRSRRPAASWCSRRTCEPAAAHAAAEGLIQASELARGARGEALRMSSCLEARGIERRAEVVPLPLLAA